MLKPKKSISKKDLKEDKFVKTTLQVKTYLDENSKQVTTVTGAILAAIALIIIFVYVLDSKKEAAEGVLGMAQIEYANGAYQKAIAHLQRLNSEYGGTDESDQGLFLLANIYYQQQKYDLAKMNFELFLDSYSGSPILESSAVSGLAACIEHEENFEEAARLYEKAAKLAGDFVESENYRYLAGLCYAKAGNTERASEQFTYILENSTVQARKDEAKQQLILLDKNS